MDAEQSHKLYNIIKKKYCYRFSSEQIMRNTVDT